jgi:hypothetical protein
MACYLKSYFLIALYVGATLAAISSASAQTVAELANEANESPAVESASPEIYSPVTAESAAREWVQKMVAKGKLPHLEGCLPVTELIDGLETRNLTCVVIGVAEARMADPTFADSFIEQRTLYAVEASLDARARIIESIATTITAEDALTLPDNPISRQFDRELRSLEATRLRARDALVPLVRAVDEALADQLAGVTQSDRLNALMDAAIKELDATWDPETVEQAKAARYQNARQAYEQAQRELDAIDAQIAEYRESLRQETTSSVITKAGGPLFGTTPLKTWESYDGETYQVALLVLWDAKADAWSRSLATGHPVPAVSPGSKSLNEYLMGKDWSRVLLGRRMIDHDGNLIVMGVGAAGLGVLTRREAETLANLQAQKNLVFTMYVNQDAEAMAEIGTQVRGVGNDVTSATKTNVAQQLMSRVEDRKIPGVTRVYSNRVVHPLTKQEMIVSVYSVSQEGMKAAMAASSDAAQLRAEDRWTQQEIAAAEAEAKRVSEQASPPSAGAAEQSTDSQLTQPVLPVEGETGVITDEDDEDEDW